ncbi:MAG: hypothetical protein MJ150_06135 [Clostridia bacterium]|nr:hypothetical protein [Clostridia bacterium]
MITLLTLFTLILSAKLIGLTMKVFGRIIGAIMGIALFVLLDGIGFIVLSLGYIFWPFVLVALLIGLVRANRSYNY